MDTLYSIELLTLKELIALEKKHVANYLLLIYMKIVLFSEKNNIFTFFLLF